MIRRREHPKVVARRRRHRRVRKKVFGTPERPRLCVFRSNRHIYAQVIDDVAGHTLVAASTLSRQIRAALKGRNATVEEARQVGVLLGTKARERGITRVVFDRGGYRYHGQVRALAEGAREAGLEF